MTRPEPLDLSVTRTVAASPEVVFDLITDVGRMADWSPEVEESAWVDADGRAEVGARFTGRNAIGSMSWTTKPKVTEVVEASVFEFRVPAPSRSTWRYELTPTETGTVVTQTLTHSKPTPPPQRNQQRPARVTPRAAHVRAAMETTLDRLAATAEHVAG